MPTEFRAEQKGPATGSEQGRPRVQENRPVTPYLVIPERSGDDGYRPQRESGWISSQSVLLLSDQGRLEAAPRPNASYRMFVLVQNLGDAPVQNGFAEFFLAPRPPIVQTDPAPVFAYQRVPMVADTSWMSLGVSAFSLASSTPARGEVGWALSPGTWRAANLGPCAVVRVFEPIQDGASQSQRSWEERKLAFRAFNPNFAGTWAGTEVDATTGAALGLVELVIAQNWNIKNKGKLQAFTPACSVNFVRFPSLPPASAEPDGIQSSMSESLYFTIIRRAGTVHLTFTFRANGSLEMQLAKNGGGLRSTTSLSLTHAGTSPPEPDKDKALLGRVRQVIPSNWSDQRKKDARIVYTAITALMP
jgi:hypothetical protein